MKKELLDAIKTATSIHKGDFTILRGKSFLICDSIENNKKWSNRVKKPREERMTLSKLAIEMREGFKQVNARLDYIVKANNLKDLSSGNK